MRYGSKKIIAVSLCAIALSACGKSEVKMGSLVQRYTMVDSKGVVFGTVELDPVNGSTIMDAKGQPFGRVVPYTVTTAAIQ